MKFRALIALILLSFMPTAAQQSLATLTGRVLDPNGEPVSGQAIASSVHAKNTATGTDITAAVDPKGVYRLTGLAPGTYDITVPIRSAMYASFEQKAVMLKAGENKVDLHIGWSANLGTIGDDPITLANDMRARNPIVKGPTPRMPDGTVDFNGMWVHIVEPPGPPNPFPYQPWAAETEKKLRALGGDNRPDVYCLPFSVLPFTAASFPHKLVQTSNLIVDLAEFDTPGYRQIFLDGRPHPDPKRWNPAWLGHSVGKWEGKDTLVIDTVGFNEAAGGVGVHTEQLHTVERLTRPDLSHLNIDMVVEDPGAWTGPWKTSAKFQLAPAEEILEFICAENNKDFLHLHDGTKGYRHRP